MKRKLKNVYMTTDTVIPKGSCTFFYNINIYTDKRKNHVFPYMQQ